MGKFSVSWQDLKSDPYYQDDWVRLYHGDALAVLADLPAASVDAVITDPPYSSGGMVRGDRMRGTLEKYADPSVRDRRVEFSGDNRDQRAYAYWCALWLGECLRVTRVGGILIQFTDWRQLPSTTDAIQAGGWIWRGIIPWAKPFGTFRLTAGRFASQCEYIVWGSNGDLRVTSGPGSALPGFYQAAAPRERDHVTQKPVDVMRELVKAIPAGGTVLDPFAGAGTTGVAATLEGRRFIGVEIAERYTAIAERRVRFARGHAVPRGDQDALDFGVPA